MRGERGRERDWERVRVRARESETEGEREEKESDSHASLRASWDIKVLSFRSYGWKMFPDYSS